LVYGIGFCFAIGHLVSHLDRDRRGSTAPPLLLILWLLLGLVNAALLLASDGPRSLLLAGIALLVVTLCGRSRHRQMGGERGPPPLRGPLLATALLLGAAVAVLPGGSSPAAMAAGFDGLGQRLALLRCFLVAAFENLNRFLYGVGFTNSSTWLCREINPGSGMIQADHLPAQVAADNGALTLLGLGFVLFLLLRQGWRLSGRLPDPVLLAALSAALYSLLVLQVDAGWARNTFLQALLGFQLGALTLRSAAPPVEAFAAEPRPRPQR
jgi:hypothetical protein